MWLRGIRLNNRKLISDFNALIRFRTIISVKNVKLAITIYATIGLWCSGYNMFDLFEGLVGGVGGVAYLAGVGRHGNITAFLGGGGGRGGVYTLFEEINLNF